MEILQRMGRVAGLGQLAWWAVCVRVGGKVIRLTLQATDASPHYLRQGPSFCLVLGCEGTAAFCLLELVCTTLRRGLTASSCTRRRIQLGKTICLI